MNEDIRKLEEKIAFLEHHVTEQDKVMLEFSEEIARLRRELRALALRVTTQGGAGDAAAGGEERPPHY